MYTDTNGIGSTLLNTGFFHGAHFLLRKWINYIPLNTDCVWCRSHCQHYELTREMSLINSCLIREHLNGYNTFRWKKIDKQQYHFFRYKTKWMLLQKASWRLVDFLWQLQSEKSTEKLGSHFILEMSKCIVSKRLE